MSKFWADSGYNCKKLKSMDHFVNGVKIQGFNCNWCRGKIKNNHFIQANGAVSRNTIHRLRHFVSRPETDSAGNGPKLFWTMSPAHYPHVAISRGHEVDCRTVAPLFLLKETDMNVPHDRTNRSQSLAL